MNDNIFLNKDGINEKKSEPEARRMLTTMLLEMMLDSDAPESVKIKLRIIDKSQEISDKVRDLVELCIPDDSNIELNYDSAKKVYEYLTLVEIGISQFMDQMSVKEE